MLLSSSPKPQANTPNDAEAYHKCSFSRAIWRSLLLKCAAKRLSMTNEIRYIPCPASKLLLIMLSQEKVHCLSQQWAHLRLHCRVEGVVRPLMLLLLGRHRSSLRQDGARSQAALRLTETANSEGLRSLAARRRLRVGQLATSWWLKPRIERARVKRATKLRPCSKAKVAKLEAEATDVAAPLERVAQNAVRTATKETGIK